MSVAKDIERRLERLVDGLAARLFHGRIHPVELGAVILRQAEKQIREVTGGWAIPNRFQVSMGGEPVDGEALASVEDELCEFIEETAVERGWRLEGPAEVEVTVDSSRRGSEVDVVASSRRGTRPAWAALHPLDPDAASLEIRVNRAVAGRSVACDLHVPHEEVSRTHAVIWRESGTTWIGDLGSSNGTTVDGSPVVGPTAIALGDVISFGGIRYELGVPR